MLTLLSGPLKDCHHKSLWLDLWVACREGANLWWMVVCKWSHRLQENAHALIKEDWTSVLRSPPHIYTRRFFLKQGRKPCSINTVYFTRKNENEKWEQVRRRYKTPAHCAKGFKCVNVVMCPCQGPGGAQFKKNQRSVLVLKYLGPLNGTHPKLRTKPVTFLTWALVYGCLLFFL